MLTFEGFNYFPRWILFKNILTKLVRGKDVHHDLWGLGRHMKVHAKWYLGKIHLHFISLLYVSLFSSWNTILIWNPSKCLIPLGVIHTSISETNFQGPQFTIFGMRVMKNIHSSNLKWNKHFRFCWGLGNKVNTTWKFLKSVDVSTSFLTNWVTFCIVTRFSSSSVLRELSSHDQLPFTGDKIGLQFPKCLSLLSTVTTCVLLIC